MGFFYFDESIQQDAGFIVGAWVYARDDMTPRVFEVLAVAGLMPGQDEFKSSARMSSNPQQLKARGRLWGLLLGRSIGAVVVPVADRARLGSEALIGLARFICAEDDLKVGHDVFLDEGIPVSQADLESFAAAVPEPCRVWPEQDSKKNGGIQLADLVSHSLGIMLLESMGFLTKMVKVGENSGYPPDSDVELGFEMFAGLRYSFLKAPMPIPNGEDILGSLVYEVEGYGLHIAASCSSGLRDAARERFGTCYMGCIH